MYKLDLEKAEEPEIKWLTSTGHQTIEKARKFKKKKSTILLHWLQESFWLYISQQTEKFLKKWEYKDILPTSWETCMQVKKQQLEPDLGQ